MDNSYNAAGHLVQLARHLMFAKGDKAQAAISAENNPTAFPEVRAILKATVGAGSLSDPAFAETLNAYRNASGAFVESLRGVSMFDTMLARGIRRVPMRARLGVVTVGIQASAVGEGQPIPVSEVQLAGSALEPIRATGLIVMTAELLRQDGGAANTLLANEMRGAVTAATDGAFLPAITTGGATVASAGATPADVLADLRALLDAVDAKAGGVLYLATDAATARALSTMPNADGSQAFPTVTPAGGELAGIPLLVTETKPDGVTGRFLTLVDTSAVVGNSDIITLRVSDQALINMTTTPGGESNAVSMFQTNSRALIAERWFAFELVRAGGVATVTGITY